MAHGIKYEPKALTEYEKFMCNKKTPDAVWPCCVQRLPSTWFLVDAKIVDFGCSVCLGLAEVKCPKTKFHVTPLDAWPFLKLAPWLKRGRRKP